MKKFLQKTLALVVAFVAMFAMSGSAFAQLVPIEFTFYQKGNYNTSQTENEVKIEYYGSNAGYDYAASANIYKSGQGYDMVISSETKTIAKVEFSMGANTYNSKKLDKILASTGEWEYQSASASTWVGSASSITFTGSASNDIYVGKVIVYVVEDTPTEIIDYNLTIIGEIPEGGSVTLDGESFTESGVHSVMANLKASDLVVVEPEGWYADKSYDSENKEFTVQFKHYYVYTVAVSYPGYHPMAGLLYKGEGYVTGMTIKSKTLIEEGNFSASDLNGYDENISVTQDSEYNYTVTVTYTESAPITYNVVLVNAPAGAKVTAYVNGEYIDYTETANFQTPLELAEYQFSVTTPESHWYETSYTSHTFTATFHEKLQYTVVVEGTEDANAGVVYNYTTYHPGSVIYSRDALNAGSVTAANVAGLEGQVSLEGYTFTVTYAKPEYISIIMTGTGVSNGNPYEKTEGGITASATSWSNCANLCNGWPITISCPEEIGVITKIVLVSNSTITNMSSSPEGFNMATLTWTASDNSTHTVQFTTNNGDYYFTEVRVWVKSLEPEPVATFDMSAAGWATLCLNKAWAVPEGYTAYAVGKDVGGVATLEEDGEIILTEIAEVPAGVGVILEGEAAVDVELFAPASTPAAPTVNFLIGNPNDEAQDWWTSGIAANYTPGDYNVYDPFGDCQLYQLAKENDKVGFYRQVEDGSTLSCGAHKAFLVVPNGVAASNARFVLPGQGATGINAIATENAEAIYNLQGQRVNAAKAGVYVKNGKKIIVK